MNTPPNLFISKFSCNSILEADAYRLARRLGVLPEDAFTEALDGGHEIAFLSHDAAACERINAEIAAQPRDPRIEFTPQQTRTFGGWEPA